MGRRASHPAAGMRTGARPDRAPVTHARIHPHALPRHHLLAQRQLADARPPSSSRSTPIPKALERVVAQLSRLPPIVVSWEVEALRERLAAAQRGEAFLLQGGDCAETFADCESDRIAKKLKILLQMSLVLLHGLKKPIIRVGRMAGQYAKPRSADTETRDGVTLPSYRGDLVNRPGVHRRGARAPIRSCCCAATSARR